MAPQTKSAGEPLQILPLSATSLPSPPGIEVPTCSCWAGWGDGDSSRDGCLYGEYLCLSSARLKAPDVRLRNTGFYLYSKMEDFIVRITHHT